MAAPEQSTMISPSLYCVWSAVSPKSRQFREPCNARGNINCDLLNPVKRKRSGFSLYDHFGEVVGVTLTRRDWDLWKHSNMWAGDNGGKSNRDTQDMIGHKNDEHLKRCLSRGESLTNRFPCFTLHPKIPRSHFTSATMTNSRIVSCSMLVHFLKQMGANKTLNGFNVHFHTCDTDTTAKQRSFSNDSHWAKQVRLSQLQTLHMDRKSLKRRRRFSWTVPKAEVNIFMGCTISLWI